MPDEILTPFTPVRQGITPGPTAYRPALVGLVMPGGGSVFYETPRGDLVTTFLSPGVKVMAAVHRVFRASGPVDGLFPPRKHLPAVTAAAGVPDDTPGGGGAEADPGLDFTAGGNSGYIPVIF